VLGESKLMGINTVVITYLDVYQAACLASSACAVAIDSSQGDAGRRGGHIDFDWEGVITK
jgi:hypothetical protein